MKKRLFSILLVLMMVVTLVPIQNKKAQATMKAKAPTVKAVAQKDSIKITVSSSEGYTYSDINILRINGEGALKESKNITLSDYTYIDTDVKPGVEYIYYAAVYHAVDGQISPYGTASAMIPKAEPTLTYCAECGENVSVATHGDHSSCTKTDYISRNTSTHRCVCKALKDAGHEVDCYLVDEEHSFTISGSEKKCTLCGYTESLEETPVAISIPSTNVEVPRMSSDVGFKSTEITFVKKDNKAQFVSFGSSILKTQFELTGPGEVTFYGGRFCTPSENNAVIGSGMQTCNTWIITKEGTYTLKADITNETYSVVTAQIKGAMNVSTATTTPKLTASTKMMSDMFYDGGNGIYGPDLKSEVDSYVQSDFAGSTSNSYLYYYTLVEDVNAGIMYDIDDLKGKFGFNTSYKVYTVAAREYELYEPIGKGGVKALSVKNGLASLSEASNVVTVVKPTLPATTLSYKKGVREANITFKVTPTNSTLGRISGFEVSKNGGKAETVTTSNLSATKKYTIPYDGTTKFKARAFFKQADGQIFYGPWSSELGTVSDKIKAPGNGGLTVVKLDSNKVCIHVSNGGGVNGMEIYAGTKKIKTVTGSYARFQYKASKAGSKTYKMRTYVTDTVSKKNYYSGYVTRKPMANKRSFAGAGSLRPKENGWAYATAHFAISKISYSGSKLKVTGYLYNKRIFDLKKAKITCSIYAEGKTFKKKITVSKKIKQYGKKKISFTVGKGIKDISSAGYSTSVAGNWLGHFEY